MKQSDIRLRNREHSLDVYLGGAEELDIRLRSKLNEMALYIRQLSIRTDISISDKLILASSTIAGELSKLIEFDEADMVLGTKMGRWVVCEIFVEMLNDALLESQIGGVVMEKPVRNILSETVLTSSELEALREMFCTIADKLTISASSKVGVSSTAFVSTPEDVMVLANAIAGCASAKTISVQETAELLTEATITLGWFVSCSEAVAYMDSTVATVLSRYRVLSELDFDESGADQYLSDIDDMSLEAADYITF